MALETRKGDQTAQDSSEIKKRVLRVSVDELSRYAHCSLFWKYHDQLRLPYRELSPEEAFSQSMRESLSRLLYGLARSKPLKAQTAALRTFDTLWRTSQEGMDWDPELVTVLTIEGHLGLQQFMGWIRGSDTVVGGKVPAEISVGSDLIVTGQLDGLIMRRDDSSDRSCGVLHVTNERSPMGSSRFQPLRLGFAQAAVRRELVERGTPVEHLIFSPYTDQPPKVTKVYHSRGWSATVQNLAKGIRHGVIYQTPHVSRCQTCFFKRICSSEHCGKTTQSGMEQIKGMLQSAKV